MSAPRLRLKPESKLNGLSSGPILESRLFTSFLSQITFHAWQPQRGLAAKPAEDLALLRIWNGGLFLASRTGPILVSALALVYPGEIDAGVGLLPDMLQWAKVKQHRLQCRAAHQLPVWSAPSRQPKRVDATTGDGSPGRSVAQST